MSKEKLYLHRWGCDHWENGVQCSEKLISEELPIGWQSAADTEHDCGLTGYSRQFPVHYCPAHHKPLKWGHVDWSAFKAKEASDASLTRP